MKTILGEQRQDYGYSITKDWLAAQSSFATSTPHCSSLITKLRLRAKQSLQGGSAAAAIFASSPSLFKRAGEAAPQVPIGQFDVAVTNIPRRSEGPCKFSVDASPKPEQAEAGIVCLGASGQKMLKSMTHGTVATFAARLAVEYDRSCTLTADTLAYFEGDLGNPVSPFIPTSDNAKKIIDQDKYQHFFLSCGAVFQNRAIASGSGENAFPAVRMLHDARGFMPLMAELIPSAVFPSAQASKTYDATNTPSWFTMVPTPSPTPPSA